MKRKNDTDLNWQKFNKKNIITGIKDATRWLKSTSTLIHENQKELDFTQTRIFYQNIIWTDDLTAKHAFNNWWGSERILIYTVNDNNHESCQMNGMNGQAVAKSEWDNELKLEKLSSKKTWSRLIINILWEHEENNFQYL